MRPTGFSKGNRRKTVLSVPLSLLSGCAEPVKGQDERSCRPPLTCQLTPLPRQFTSVIQRAKPATPNLTILGSEATAQYGGSAPIPPSLYISAGRARQRYIGESKRKKRKKIQKSGCRLVFSRVSGLIEHMYMCHPRVTHIRVILE